MANTAPADCVSITGYYGRAPNGTTEYTFGNPLSTYNGYKAYFRVFIPPGTIMEDLNIIENNSHHVVARHKVPPTGRPFAPPAGYVYTNPLVLSELEAAEQWAKPNVEGFLHITRDSFSPTLLVGRAGWLYVKVDGGESEIYTTQFMSIVDTKTYNEWFDTYIKDEAGWNKYIQSVETYDGSPAGDGEKLFLEFNGTDGSQSFVDSSAEGNTILWYGNARISTTQSMFRGSSCWLNGVGDTYLSTSGDSTAFDFDTTDFTLELWIRPDTVTNIGAGLLVKANAWGIYQNGAGLYFEYGDNTVYFGADSLTATQWSHVAVSREGSHLFCSVNGTVEDLQGTSDAFVADYATRVTIGRGTEAKYFSGYLDDIKIYKGVAKYTADFNPYPDASAYITVAPTTLSFGSVSIA